MQTNLEAFGPMIGGVLKAAGLRPGDRDYADYRQELFLLLWQRLRTGEHLAPTNNPGLFRWLLWRLRDKQRQAWRYQAKVELGDDADRQAVVDPRKSLEGRLLIANLESKLVPHSTAARLYHLYLQRPGLFQKAYCQILGIHRTTLHRCLKRMAKILTDNEAK